VCVGGRGSVVTSWERMEEGGEDGKERMRRDRKSSLGGENNGL
jgi:hypothetical protein